MLKSLPPENKQQVFVTEQLTSKSLNTWSSSCCPRTSNLSPVAFNFPACVGLRKVSPGWSFKIKIIIKHVKYEKPSLTTFQNTRGPFLESPGNFSGPESHNKILNLTITELFYSHILNMNRRSLYTRSFRHIHFSAFRYSWTKNGFTGPRSFRGFRETDHRAGLFKAWLS